MNYCTYHSIARAKERQNKSASKADNEFALVLRYGKRVSDLRSSAQRKYIKSKETQANARVYVYEDYCYIFDAKHDKCITTYKLPNWFNRSTHYVGKDRIRKVRVYNRLNPIDYGDEEAA